MWSAHYLPLPSLPWITALSLPPFNFWKLSRRTDHDHVKELTDEGKEDGATALGLQVGACLQRPDGMVTTKRLQAGYRMLSYCPSWTQIMDGSTHPLPHHLPKANGKRETFWGQAAERKLGRKDDGKEQVGIWGGDGLRTLNVVSILPPKMYSMGSHHLAFYLSR